MHQLTRWTLLGAVIKRYCKEPLYFHLRCLPSSSLRRAEPVIVDDVVIGEDGLLNLDPSCARCGQLLFSPALYHRLYAFVQQMHAATPDVPA